MNAASQRQTGKSFLLLFFKKEVLAFLWLTVAALLGWIVFRWAAYAITVVRSPFIVDASEGAVWQQLTRIPGAQMYGDINVYPFLIFEYPPLYHLVVRAVAALGVDTLAAGRAVSAAASVAAGGLIGVVVHGVLRGMSARVRLCCALLAGVLPASLLPVIIWSCLMRVDMLGLALTYGGIALGLAAFRRQHLLYGSMLLFVLACYTKQTFVAAPAAMLAVHALRDWRLALRAGGLGLVAGLAVLGCLAWYTQGGFVRHVLLYNVNRFDLSQALVKIISWIAAYPTLVLLALAGVAVAWRRRQDNNVVFLSLYLLLATAMLLASGKAGANLNYFIEWMCLWCVWIGLLAGFAFSQFARSPPYFAVPALLIVQLSQVPGNFDRLYVTHLSPAYKAAEQALVARLREIPGPVLSDDLIVLRRAEKPLGPEMPMLAELAFNGRWDGDELLSMIEGDRFGAILTQYGPGAAEFEERYLPPVQAAIALHYPVVVRFNEFRLCLRRQQAP